MLKLPACTLSLDQQALLEQKQGQINALPDYAAQVAMARELWQSKGDFAVVRSVLATQCCGQQRCHYCEDSYGDEVEHVWPKKFYPCRAFVWHNYLLACGRCNAACKRDQWAVFVNGDEEMDVTRGRHAPVLPVPDGAPVFLDPHEDDPLFFIELDFVTGQFVPRAMLSARDQKRAAYTIKILKLNDEFLLVARQVAYRDFVANIRRYVSAKQASEQEQCALELDILQRRNHQSIWAEMKRLAQEGVAHHDVLIAAPELWE